MKSISGMTLEFSKFIIAEKANQYYSVELQQFMNTKSKTNYEHGIHKLVRVLRQHRMVDSCMLMTALKYPNESLTELLFRFNWAQRHTIIMGKRFEDYLEFQVYRLIAQQALYQKGLAKIQTIVQSNFAKRKYLRKWRDICRKKKQPLSRLTIQKLYLRNTLDIVCMILQRNLYSGFQKIKIRSQQMRHKPCRRQALSRMITTLNHYELRLTYFHFANSPIQIQTFDMKHFTAKLLLSRLKEVFGIKQMIDNFYWHHKATLILTGILQRKQIGRTRSALQKIKLIANVSGKIHVVLSPSRNLSGFICRSLKRVVQKKRRQGFEAIKLASQNRANKIRLQQMKILSKYYLSRVATINQSIKKKLLVGSFQKLYMNAVRALTEVNDPFFQEVAISGIKTIGLIIREKTKAEVQERKGPSSIAISVLISTIEAIQERKLEQSLEAIKSKATMDSQEVEEFEVRAEICAKEVIYGIRNPFSGPEVQKSAKDLINKANEYMKFICTSMGKTFEIGKTLKPILPIYLCSYCGRKFNRPCEVGGHVSQMHSKFKLRKNIVKKQEGIMVKTEGQF